MTRKGNNGMRMEAAKALRMLCAATILCTASWSLAAQSSLDRSDFGVASKIAPGYFGPYAFPVPDMLDGTTSEELKLELGGEYCLGHRGDHTGGVTAKVTIPLFTDRVNLTVWMPPVMEFYRTSAEWRTHNRLPETVSDRFSSKNSSEVTSRGYGWGDVYVSTDIRVLKEGGWWPDITVRAAVKTASGDNYSKARFYDSPGYFFDASFAKSIRFDGGREGHSGSGTQSRGTSGKSASGKSALGNGACRNSASGHGICGAGRFVRELRFAVSGGFLCWQTDVGRQNDAVMYGVMAALDTRAFCVNVTYGGYSGWEKDGDRPMSLKTCLKGHIGRFSPFLYCQLGLKDYPYTQFRLGLEYSVPILKRH